MAFPMVQAFAMVASEAFSIGSDLQQLNESQRISLYFLMIKNLTVRFLLVSNYQEATSSKLLVVLDTAIMSR